MCSALVTLLKKDNLIMNRNVSGRNNAIICEYFIFQIRKFSDVCAAVGDGIPKIAAALLKHQTKKGMFLRGKHAFYISSFLLVG